MLDKGQYYYLSSKDKQDLTVENLDLFQRAQKAKL